MPDDQTTAEAAPATGTKGKAHRLPYQGSVNATVFENHGANGRFFTVDLQRSYMDGETRKYTHSFKPTDMPDVIKQAAAVQEKIAELTQAQGQAR